MNQLRSVLVALVALTAFSGVALADEEGSANATSQRLHTESPAVQRPSWIWATSQRRSGQNATLTKSFSLRGGIERATLYLAADFTRCSVHVGDSLLVKLDEYAPWIELDVTNILVNGINEISLSCKSGEGPAAVAISLYVEYADGSSENIVTSQDWKTGVGSAFSFGVVAEEFWSLSKVARVSAFEDYEQWRRASGTDAATDPATFATQPGFEVDLVRSAKPDEGSWVSMAFDSKGRVTIAREDKGLLRMSLSKQGAQIGEVEVIEETLQECRGLLYAHDALYANANNSKGMYRLRDTDGDDQFDEVKLLREFPGGVGHGRNDLALGPDGLIYSIHGDSVELATDDIKDHTSPLRAARRGEVSNEGHLVRTDRDGKGWELVASGLRNPFGIDFNRDGELFTYDADNEYDMGSPWYRPTRIDHLVAGADFGWRRKKNGQWPPYYPDHADNALPSVDVGKGSPTAVKSGRDSSFPDRYQNALFMLDWAYGRVLAFHPSPRGAGYVGRVESFLAGRPLNVTDLDFGPDGSMYVITGGRKTQSAIYRVRYTGAKQEAIPPTPQQRKRAEYSRRQRELRKRLADLFDQDEVDLNVAWKHLGSPDPVIRTTARVAVEHRSVERWRTHALEEPNVEIASTALLALARVGDDQDRTALLTRLDVLHVDDMTANSKLSLLHAYRLLLIDADEADPRVVRTSSRRLFRWLESETSPLVAPLGSGYSVRQELARLVADLHVPGAVPLLIELLRTAQSQRDRMNALYMLCHQTDGWTLDQRTLFFDSLGELERTAFSGAGMPGRLQQIRDRAVAELDEKERLHLGDLTRRVTVNHHHRQTIVRPFVRKWTLEDLVKARQESATRGNPDRGRILFRDVLCVSCHRLGGRGGVLGPDLTAVASRFSMTDLLASIVSPSDVIAQKYRGTQVMTSDGRMISGRVVSGGDYRSSDLQIATDPLDPGKVVVIAKKDVERHRPSSISPMPEGLLDTLTIEEVNDLLAFLTRTP